MKLISRTDLAEWLASEHPPVLIEALPASYYQEAHLPGAINIPHDEIVRQAASLLPDKQEQIVVYCASAPCKNSAIAAETLDLLGYRNVFEYVEGKEDWEAAGLPLESGTAADAA